jgi:hypothetical protein
MRSAPASGDVLKATRLADPGMVQMSASQAGATRLAPPNADYAQVAPGYFPQQPNQARPSLLSKLNWKHFAGAGAVLVAIVGLATFALVGGGSKSTTPPAPVQPAAASPSAAAPVEQSSTPNLQTVPTQPAAPVAGNQPSSGSSSSTERSRDRGAQKAADSQSAAAAPAEPPPVQAEQPHAQPSAPKPEHTAAAKIPEKREPLKSEAKKDDKKVVEKVGGFFKKVFGGDKKKDDKKN